MTLVSFREMRNKVKVRSFSPPRELVSALIPSIRKLLQCLGLNVPNGGQPAPEPKSVVETLTPLEHVKSKYSPLADYLKGYPDQQGRITMGFLQLETILGRQLPPSARKYRAWWGNHRGNSQARAWLEAGWTINAVDFGAATVTFRRVV